MMRIFNVSLSNCLQALWTWSWGNRMIWIWFKMFQLSEQDRCRLSWLRSRLNNAFFISMSAPLMFWLLNGAWREPRRSWECLCKESWRIGQERCPWGPWTFSSLTHSSARWPSERLSSVSLVLLLPRFHRMIDIFLSPLSSPNQAEPYDSLSDFPVPSSDAGIHNKIKKLLLC